MLPVIIQQLCIANGVDKMFWLSYVLTLAKVQSKCHIDPPFGSGWQFLSEGRKEWTIFDKHFFYEIPVAADQLSFLIMTKTDKFSVLEIRPSVAALPLTSNFNSQNDYDVEQLSKFYPNELYRCTLNASDFISCPEDWPHAVMTTVKTCGLSGYMKYEKTE